MKNHRSKNSSLIHNDLWKAICLLFILSVPHTGCTSTSSLLTSSVEIPIPSQSDWVDYGTIFTHGELGEWDYYLYGGFTNTVVRKDGIFYLYYQGASDYRTEYDETVLWRAIGVATSPDGINFTKYDGNPVITWFPKNMGEEGAVSGGVTLDEDGKIMLYYGANTAESHTTINADVRQAVSVDGIHFIDQGIVLGHSDISVWGSGDELFPILAIHDQDDRLVYYIPNGTLQSGVLGLAVGNNDNQSFSSTRRVRSGIKSIPIWGTGGAAKVGVDLYALMLNNVRENKIEIRLMHLAAPQILSSPIETYQFAHVKQATIWLDEELNTWYMFYRGEEEYGVMVAKLEDANVIQANSTN